MGFLKAFGYIASWDEGMHETPLSRAATLCQPRTKTPALGTGGSARGDPWHADLSKHG